MRKSLIYALVLLAMLVFAGSARAGTSYDDSNVVITDSAIYPKTDAALTVGKSGNEFSNGYFDSLTVNGSVYTSFAAGTDGNWTDDGVVLTLDQAPTKFIATYSSGEFFSTALRVGSGDIYLEKNQKIDGGTSDTFTFSSSSDYVTMKFNGDDAILNNSDGGFTFTLTDGTDGTVDIMANNDSDDYLTIYTSSNVPTIGTAGTSNLALAPDSGIVAVASSETIAGNLAITGGTTFGSTLTLSNSETIANGTNGTVTVSGNAAGQILDILDAGTSDSDATLSLSADAAADNGDVWRLTADGTTNSLFFENNTSGSQATILTLANTGLITTTGDLTVVGTTPLITVGDGGNEDAGVQFNGQSTSDFYVATDNADDQLIIGYGSSIGTDARIKINDDAAETRITLGDAATADQVVVFDGAESDYYMALDYSAGDFLMGVGATVATTPILRVTSGDNIEIYGKMTADKGVNYAADTSSSDDYVVTLTPAPAALTPGMTVTFWAKTANTGACTLNVNGLGAKPIKVLHDDTASDNWIEASSMVMCVYDGNNFQLMTPRAN